MRRMLVLIVMLAGGIAGVAARGGIAVASRAAEARIIVRFHIKPGGSFIRNVTVKFDGRVVFQSPPGRTVDYERFWPNGIALQHSDYSMARDGDRLDFDAYAELFNASVPSGKKYTCEVAYETGLTAINLDPSCAQRYGLIVQPGAPTPLDAPHRWDQQRRTRAADLIVEERAEYMLHIGAFEVGTETEYSCRTGRFIGVTTPMRGEVAIQTDEPR